MEKKQVKNLSKTKYLNFLTKVSGEKNNKYTTLILTFIALSIFGFFAISPTISTIVQLDKQIKDSELVNEQLETKRKNLISLQQQYPSINQQSILNALPQTPQVPILVGQIQAIAQKNSLTISKFQTFSVQLPTEKDNSPAYENGLAFSFTFDTAGSYEDISSFISELVSFNRIVTLDTVSLTQSTNETDSWQLNIRGNAYLKK